MHLSRDVAIVAELQETGLSLWAEGLNDCYLDSVRWNTWPDLKPPSRDEADSWSRDVQSKLAQLLEDTASNSNTDDGVILIPTGSAWTPTLLRALRSTSMLQIHEISEPGFAASMNAAKIVRAEERADIESKSDEYGVETPYFVGRYPYMLQDKLWTVGGNCLDDTGCEYSWQGRVVPVCHPVGHVCMCGELWEEEPGAKREELYRKIWEAGPAVIRRLSAPVEPPFWPYCPAEGTWDQKEWKRLRMSEVMQ